MISGAVLENLWAFPIEIRALREVSSSVPRKYRQGHEYQQLVELCDNTAKRLQATSDYGNHILMTYLSDSLIRDILIDKFTKRKTIEKLADQYGYSTRQIGRLIKRGIDELQNKGIYFETGEL